MRAVETTGMSDADREIVALLEKALEKLRRTSPKRKRVTGHVEAALKCLTDPRESILPSDLNSANDG